MTIHHYGCGDPITASIVALALIISLVFVIAFALIITFVLIAVIQFQIQFN